MTLSAKVNCCKVCIMLKVRSIQDCCLDGNTGQDLSDLYTKPEQQSLKYLGLLKAPLKESRIPMILTLKQEKGYKQVGIQLYKDTVRDLSDVDIKT